MGRELKRVPMDFSKMIFEERTIEGDQREIRIVAPRALPRPDTRLVGNEARKRMLRFVFGAVAGVVPRLDRELQAECLEAIRLVDLEDSVN